MTEPLMFEAEGEVSVLNELLQRSTGLAIKRALFGLLCLQSA